VRPRPSTVVSGFAGTMSLSDSRSDRRPRRRWQSRPASRSESPTLPSRLSLRAVPTTPVDHGRSLRFIPSVQRPSPRFRGIGIHIYTFGACSGFTRVTARNIACLPKVDFTRGLTLGVPGLLPGEPTIARMRLALICLTGPSWRTELHESEARAKC
jgi:hypothetical protein